MVEGQEKFHTTLKKHVPNNIRIHRDWNGPNGIKKWRNVYGVMRVDAFTRIRR